MWWEIGEGSALPHSITARLSKPKAVFTQGLDISMSGRVHLEGKPRCRVFLLIIGIDKYRSKDIRDLKGCVNDVRNVEKYFTTRFRIPEVQIARLLDDQATRRAILEKFQTHLIDNPVIERNDPIIIYFAGHGSRVDAPSSWLSGPDGKIEMLVPHDATWNGQIVHGIPDRTIHALLRTLASVKGNNISVFFDCCYSASCTRKNAPGTCLSDTRFIETPHTMVIPEDLDQSLLGRCSVLVESPPGAVHNQFDSHILVAACGDREHAYEITPVAGEPCGYFTHHLIEQLRSVGSNPITYASLVALVPASPNQNPECKGVNQNRYLFELQPTHNLTGNVREDGTIEIGAGSLHGVAIGSQFVVETRRGGQELHHTLVARSVRQDSSILLPITHINDLASLHGARVVRVYGETHLAVMTVYFRANERRTLMIEDGSVQAGRKYFFLVDSSDNADLIVERSSEDFVLTRLDAKLSRYRFAIPDVHLNISIARLPDALNVVAHFNYFLAKHNGHEPFAKEVNLGMYDLSGDGSNLVDEDEEVQVCLNTQSKYDVAIRNYSPYNLFPYLFRFDPMSYSIEALYLPQSTSKAPLAAKSGPKPTQLKVGYRAGEGHAMAFLKLFVSTKYLDLSRISQPAAVEVRRDEHGEQCFPVDDNKIWGSVDVTVTHYTKDPQ